MEKMAPGPHRRRVQPMEAPRMSSSRPEDNQPRGRSHLHRGFSDGANVDLVGRSDREAASTAPLRARWIFPLLLFQWRTQKPVFIATFRF